MKDFPKIGTMIRCVGSSFDVGAVTYSGHESIRLPHRTDTGKIIPDTFDLYQLTRVGVEWFYEFRAGTHMNRDSRT